MTIYAECWNKDAAGNIPELPNDTMDIPDGEWTGQQLINLTKRKGNNIPWKEIFPNKTTLRILPGIFDIENATPKKNTQMRIEDGEHRVLVRGKDVHVNVTGKTALIFDGEIPVQIRMANKQPTF